MFTLFHFGFQIVKLAIQAAFYSVITSFLLFIVKK